MRNYIRFASSEFSTHFAFCVSKFKDQSYVDARTFENVIGPVADFRVLSIRWIYPHGKFRDRFRTWTIPVPKEI